jgi:hypothetical protein
LGARHISYCKKKLKRNPNYEIKENQNSNPGEILLRNRRKYKPHLPISQLLQNL